MTCSASKYTLNCLLVSYPVFNSIKQCNLQHLMEASGHYRRDNYVYEHTIFILLLPLHLLPPPPFSGITIAPAIYCCISFVLMCSGIPSLNHNNQFFSCKRSGYFSSVLKYTYSKGKHLFWFRYNGCDLSETVMLSSRLSFYKNTLIWVLFSPHAILFLATHQLEPQSFYHSSPWSVCNSSSPDNQYWSVEHCEDKLLQEKKSFTTVENCGQ